MHIKVFRADTIAAKAKKALRLGKGEREAKHLQEAGAAGLPTIEPLAFGTAIEGDQHNSFLVTRSVASDDFCFPAPQKSPTASARSFAACMTPASNRSTFTRATYCCKQTANRCCAT